MKKFVCTNLELIKSEIEKIRSFGVEPIKCPTCGCKTKYPAPHQAMNALSRQDNNTYICNLCGNMEFADDIRRAKK